MVSSVCPVSKMEKFLVATDGSEFSRSAVREAINLAKICSGKLIVLSVVATYPEFEGFTPEILERAENEAKAHMESAQSSAATKGVDCETIVHYGEQPFQDIIDSAVKYHADMIIMGTHGRTGLKRLMMGSVTAKVIGHSPCNVLVVPVAAKIECKHILAATDGSRYGDAAVSQAIDIAKKCGSSITVLSVALTDEELELPDETAQIAIAEEHARKAIAHAEKEGIQPEELILKGKPYKAIVEASMLKHTDLIVLGSHGRTGVERLLMGSVTERVIGHAQSAVLVVKI